MSCCEQQKIDRLKNLKHASILAAATAGITGRAQGVVKKKHRQYGEYYEGMDYEQARAEGLKIFRKLNPV